MKTNSSHTSRALRRPLFFLGALCILTLAVGWMTSRTVHAQDSDSDGSGKPFIKQPYNDRPGRRHHDAMSTNTWMLEPEVEGSKAHGKFYLVCYSDDQDNFRLDVGGLNPHKTYTVWFVSSLKPDAARAGAGFEPFSFKTGGSGNAIFQGSTKFCPLVKYRWLEVREHDDGDTLDLLKSARVLKAHIIPN